MGYATEQHNQHNYESVSFTGWFNVFRKKLLGSVFFGGKGMV